MNEVFREQLAVILHFEFRRRRPGLVWNEESQEAKALWLDIAEKANDEIKSADYLYD